MPSIRIHKSAGGVRIPRQMLIQLGKIVLHGERQNRQVTLVFVSDGEMKKLNRQFRGRNSTTDVLSFALDRDDSKEGEIYISFNEARKNVKRYGGTQTTEFLKLFCHGLLHLCGIHHTDQEAQAQMVSKENHYLHQLRKQTVR